MITKLGTSNQRSFFFILQSINTVCSGLERLHTARHAIAQLCQRLGGYGVQSSHEGGPQFDQGGGLVH